MKILKVQVRRHHLIFIQSKYLRYKMHQILPQYQSDLLYSYKVFQKFVLFKGNNITNMAFMHKLVVEKAMQMEGWQTREAEEKLSKQQGRDQSI